MNIKDTNGGPNRDPQYQQKWRRALNAIMRLLAKRAEEGGVNGGEIKDILQAELRIGDKIAQDALDYLAREGHSSRETVRGELVNGDIYSLTPKGIVELAGGRDPYVTLRLVDE